MVINIRVVENASLYTYGEWVSPTLQTSLFLLPASLDDWGMLTWDEQYTVEKGDGDGYVRVDILKASDNSILVENLYWLSAGTDLSNYPLVVDNDIKVRVKIYGMSNPTPRVSKLLIRSKYGGDYSMLTKKGLMTFLERAVKTTPTRTKIATFDVGTGTTAPTVNDTALTTSVLNTALNAESTITEDEGNGLIKVRGALGTGDANGNDLTESGFKNADLCSHEVWTPAISKTNAITVNFIWNIQAENA
jgi:hypothetical protein